MRCRKRDLVDPEPSGSGPTLIDAAAKARAWRQVGVSVPELAAEATKVAEAWDKIAILAPEPFEALNASQELNNILADVEADMDVLRNYQISNC